MITIWRTNQLKLITVEAALHEETSEPYLGIDITTGAIGQLNLVDPFDDDSL